MSDPDDDLHGRQLALLLLFFGSVGGGLYFVGWLTRPSFFYDNPLVCAMIAGGACHPARWLVEQFAWWKRLELPSRRTQARRERARQRDLAEAQEAARLRQGEDAIPAARGKHSRPYPGWRGWLDIVRVTVGGLLVLASLAIAPVGISAARHDRDVARTAPVQQAVVLSVTVDNWSRTHDVTITVRHPVDGSKVEIDGAYDLDRLPEVGERIAVQVDPDDSSNVLAADADWGVPWYAYALIVLGALICAGVCFAIFF